MIREKEELNVRTSNLLVYHYDGREINRSTARLLSSSFSCSLEEQQKKRKDVREGERGKEMLLSALLTPTALNKGRRLLYIIGGHTNPAHQRPIY